MRNEKFIPLALFKENMEFTDYMLWKFGILVALAFLYGLIFG